MNATDLILITGAGGFIGSNLTDELVRKGFRVRAFVRKGESKERIADLIKDNKVEVVLGDLLDKVSVKKACRNADFIFHLAAKTDLEATTYLPYYQNNVLGTKNLVGAGGEGLKRFLFYSSILATGLPNSRKLLTEDYKGPWKHHYGRSKKEAEDFLLEQFKTRGFPVTIIRPTTVYGPGDFGVQYQFFKAINEGKFLMIGNGKNSMSYVYVKNLVEATIQAAFSSNTLGQIYLVNDRTPYTFGEIVETIYKIMSKTPPKFYVPFPVAYVGAALYSFLAKALGKKPLIYPSRVKTMVTNYAYSVAKSEKDFGYKPKYGLEEGVKETYLWYKENGYLS